MSEGGNVSTEFLRREVRRLREEAAKSAAESKEPLGKGPGGPHDDGMEARVARLEADVAEMKADMKTALRDLSYLRGRLEQLPTTWAMVTTIIGGQIALAGILIAALRLTPH